MANNISNLDLIMNAWTGNSGIIKLIDNATNAEGLCIDCDNFNPPISSYCFNISEGKIRLERSTDHFHSIQGGISRYCGFTSSPVAINYMKKTLTVLAEDGEDNEAEWGLMFSDFSGGPISENEALAEVVADKMNGFKLIFQ